jgi:hypothetical protein
MLAVVSIGLAVTILAGVRHEPAVRAWALSPRTPRRVAHVITRATSAVATALATAVVATGTAALLVVAFVGAVNQAAGAL